MEDPIQLISKRVHTDPELNTRIYAQLCHLKPEVFMEEDDKNLFLTHVLQVMHKLHATKYHLKNYKRIENEQSQQCTKLFAKQPNERREALELIFEIEALLYQVKSSLDMLVKLMIPILAPHKVTTETYEKKGDSLVKGLEAYKHRKDSNKEAADALIGLIKQDKDDWIERVVGMRDELNHRRGLRDFQFEPIRLPSGKLIAQKPRFKGMDTLQFLESVYQCNLEYQQDFMCYALSIKAPAAFKLAVLPDDSPIRESFGPDGAFLRWGWSFTPKADGDGHEQSQ